MVVRSLIDSLLFSLGLVPSNTNFEEIKKNIENIELSKISSILLKYRFRGSSDRHRLIEKLDKLGLNREIQDRIYSDMDSSDTLWDRLKYCGSGIEKFMFDNIPIEGSHYSTYKILTGNTYSKEFLKRFEYLWVRDKALRRLEWKLLKIGRLYNRTPIILYMPDDIVDKILDKKTDLIDVIAISCESWSLTNQNLFRYSIGKALIYRAKHDSNIHRNIYKLFRQWLDLDPVHCVVIMGNSLKKSGEYNSTKLLDRFHNRIKSDKHLGKKLNDDYQYK